MALLRDGGCARSIPEPGDQRLSLFGFFHNPEREARRLERDARAIIDNVVHSYREQRLVEIASQIRTDLLHVARNCEAHDGSLERELERHTSLHREARRHNASVALTAHTLVIIHIRAGRLGEPGQATLGLIQDFVSNWSSGDPPFPQPQTPE